MIVTEAVERYLTSLRPHPDPVLAEMEAHARRAGIPIVVPETGALLHVMAGAVRARRVVEVGTAIGVSTLYIARALDAEGWIVSFDVDAQRLQDARAYLNRAGVGEQVDLRLKDARQGLGELDGTFDLAFIDAQKAEYGDYLTRIVPLMRPGGVIAVDNVLMGGAVADDRQGSGANWSADQVERAREFNRQLLAHPLLSATITPVGDGVAVAVRR
jgi:predicted O-methyltransferase YrrM